MRLSDENAGVDRIQAWFDAALEAVDPYRAVAAGLQRSERSLVAGGTAVPVEGMLHVVAIGKAALPMAAAAADVAADLVSGGTILTKDGHATGAIPRSMRIFECAHPVPEARNVDATRALLEELGSLGDGDVVLALISGGGSALMEAPLSGVTLADIAETTRALLMAGAPIQDLNAVRVPLSAVKGGGLRRSAPRARFVTMILSDVMGNDTQVIASGPTVPTTFKGNGALETLERYGLVERVPSAVVAALSATVYRDAGAMFDADMVTIVGDNDLAVEAFARAAIESGVRAQISWRQRQGEARELAAEWVDELANADAETELLLGGGEAIVTVRGDGVGGRSTEFVLAATLEMERRGLGEWLVASLATDGQDALTGVAGAIGSVRTLERARAAGIDPLAALDRNDSLTVFRAGGGAVVTGPTGTNVNDVYVALRVASDQGYEAKNVIFVRLGLWG